MASTLANVCKVLLVLGLVTYSLFIFFPNSASEFFSPSNKGPLTITNSPTNLSHLIFGLLGSEQAWHHRKPYIESWWRPNATRGLLYLDKPPTGDLLPWSPASPSYRVSDNITKLLQETNAAVPVMIRMVHAIMEVMRDGETGNNDLRWVVMGDDDTLFFVDNIVDVLGRYDHRKFYYLGGPSEFVMSNYWFSFNQGFGGAGFMLSYPLAKAVADDMENCLRRNSQLNSADLITMVCVADIGANLSPQKGIHQIDLEGDISGFLSAHPKSPLMSLHHFDMVEPIFPNMDRFESTRHLMAAAAGDQSRMLQQIICHYRQHEWTFSISWGYSAHIYEKIMPRYWLQKPIETFKPWIGYRRDPPLYMFNTRLPSSDPCETPHVFFFKKLQQGSAGILTTYTRTAERGLPPCSSNISRTADFVSEIHVLSPRTSRNEMDRCECCDVVRVEGAKAELKLRECMVNEIIA